MTDLFLPPEPHHGIAPAWLDPLPGELGVAVPFQAVLADTGEDALAVRHLVAHSNGFEFTLGYRSRRRLHTLHWGRHDGTDWMPILGRLPDELFRIAVVFDDGRRATSLEESGSFRPEGPTIREREGSGGRLWWDGRYWVGPVPARDGVELVCEWPVAGIGPTSLELPAAALRAAGLRSRSARH